MTDSVLEGDINWCRHFFTSPIASMILAGSINGNAPLWFLLSLLGVQLLFNGLVGHKCSPLLIFWGGLILAFLIYLWKCKYCPLYLGNMSLGLSCYSMGYLLRDKQFDRRLLAICLLIYLLSLLYPMRIDFRYNRLVSPEGIYLLGVAFSLAGCIVINNFFKKIGRLRLLALIGRYSMKFYLWHWIMLIICRIIVVRIWHLDNEILFYSMLFACLLVMPLVIRLTNNIHWIYGESKKYEC